jgi:hypothetical protein
MQSFNPNPQSLDIILILDGTNHGEEYGANRLRIQCYAMLCYVMLCYAMLCYAMLCYATLCCVVLCCVVLCCVVFFGILRLKCDGTRAETRFRLSAKRTSLFKSAGASVQSTTGSRGVRISGSNAGYIMFRRSVKSTGYPLDSPVSPSLPPPVRRRVPSHSNWTLHIT